MPVKWSSGRTKIESSLYTSHSTFAFLGTRSSWSGSFNFSHSTLWRLQRGFNSIFLMSLQGLPPRPTPWSNRLNRTILCSCSTSSARKRTASRQERYASATLSIVAHCSWKPCLNELWRILRLAKICGNARRKFHFLSYRPTWSRSCMRSVLSCLPNRKSLEKLSVTWKYWNICH